MDPRPYHPPDLGDPPPPPVPKGMPWAARRKGETERERQARLSHTCWRCGRYEKDLAKLDAHEETHPPQGQRRE